MAKAVVVRRTAGPRPTSRRRRPGGSGSARPGSARLRTSCAGFRTRRSASSGPPPACARRCRVGPPRPARGRRPAASTRPASPRLAAFHSSTNGAARRTVISCRAEPVQASWFASVGGHAGAESLPVAALAGTSARQARMVIRPFIQPCRLRWPGDGVDPAHDPRDPAAVHAQRLAGDQGRPAVLMAPGMSGRAGAAPARAHELLGLRPPRAHGHADRPRECRPRPDESLSTAVLGRVPDPADALGGRVRRERRPVDGRGQHLGLQLPVRLGTSRWSMHAYGKAIDVNPVENPYVSGGRVSPPSGRAYLDRSRVRPGMAVEGGSSCEPSRRSAGSGAAGGPAPRTTSTFRRPAASPGRRT